MIFNASISSGCISEVLIETAEIESVRVGEEEDAHNDGGPFHRLTLSFDGGSVELFGNPEEFRSLCSSFEELPSE